MTIINIKPLSVNDVWQGKRYKTPKYKRYENDVLMLLPQMELPKPPLVLHLEFGMSSHASDYDNPVKPFQDILCKKYGFNDNDIDFGSQRKKVVPKGQEYIKFKLLSDDGFSFF